MLIKKSITINVEGITIRLYNQREKRDSLMEEIAERLKDYFVQDDVKKSQELIRSLTVTFEWKEIVGLLKNVTSSLYQGHFLKKHHMILSIFDLFELAGIDCDIFSEMKAIRQPSSFDEACSLLFENFIQIAKAQFQSGGSTLFFNVEKLKTTRSAVIVSDLLEARYRETIFILAEIDELLPTLHNEWINASRLWRIGYGMKILRARKQGLLIHINEYKKIRNRILNELEINPETIIKQRNQLIQKHNHDYLQISKELDMFVTGYISSLGIRGQFEPPFKSLIDHEGLDEF